MPCENRLSVQGKNKVSWWYSVATVKCGDVRSNSVFLQCIDSFRSVGKAVSLQAKDKILLLFFNAKWAAMFIACSMFPLTEY